MMFYHIFRNRLKISWRDRQMLFWTFMFPIILSTFFGMAFSNLSANEVFQTFPIGVIANDNYQQDQALREALAAASDNSGARKALFTVQLLSEAEADAALAANEIVGYLVADNPMQVVVNSSGIRQTILKIFTDEYLQVRSAVDNIVASDPAVWQQLLARLEARVDFLEDKPVSQASPDTTIIYFYALIAMTCLYGGMWGMKEIIAIQANLSGQAARVNLVPVSKMRFFFASLLAVLLVQLATVVILFIYLRYVIGISFGSQTGLIVLAGLSGSIFGIAIGALIGAISRISENIKNPLLIGVSLLSAFLAGLMIIDIKPMVMRAFPPVSFLNPASLISDTFYALYFYDNLNRYFLNIALQAGYSLVLLILVVLILRRRRYASI